MQQEFQRNVLYVKKTVQRYSGTGKQQVEFLANLCTIQEIRFVGKPMMKNSNQLKIKYMFIKKKPLAKSPNIKMAGAAIHQAPINYAKIVQLSTKKKLKNGK